MPRTNTALNFVQAYDPTFPIRSRQSKLSPAETTAEMASIVAMKATASPDSCVTEDDLRNAGFTSREINLYYPDAAVLASERLAPMIIEVVPTTDGPAPQAPAPIATPPLAAAGVITSNAAPLPRRQGAHKRSRSARSA